MIHALVTLEGFRRNGVGRMMMSGAARFAQEQGARWLALAVTERNIGAGAFYRDLGMEAIGRYHYREKQD